MAKPSSQSIPNQPRVAIVILNWNGLDDTTACLESLGSITYLNYMVIVVDNGSDSQEGKKLKKKFPTIHLIQNKNNLGFTGGCNQGIDYGLSKVADYVLLLNNDTTVTPDFLSKLVNLYESEPTAGAVSSVILYADKKTIWFAGGRIILGVTRLFCKGKKLSDERLPLKPYSTDFVTGGCFLMSAAVINKVGKLDNRYFIYLDDIDWCYRAKKMGYYPYVVPDSLIYHKKSSSTGEGGKAKFSKGPAFLLARNGVWFGSNIDGFDRFIYLLSQIVFKLPVSFILLIKPGAWWSYIKGLFIGFRDFNRVPPEY